MAGRGRGGPGGRGRGRGAMSFNVEQLGFGVGEALPGPVLQPPPVYPLMENRPAPLESAPEVEYWLALKREYIEFLHDSPAYLVAVAAKTDVERYSDRYQALESQSAKGYNHLKFDVKRLPAELRPIMKSKTKRKRKSVGNKASAKVPKKLEELEDRLKELEKNEDQVEEEEDEAEDDKDEEKEGEVEEADDEEEVDEEMDEGTDYANNYFDNGESFIDDEDDNLEDGPVY